MEKNKKLKSVINDLGFDTFLRFCNEEEKRNDFDYKTLFNVFTDSEMKNEVDIFKQIFDQLKSEYFSLLENFKTTYLSGNVSEVLSSIDKSVLDVDFVDLTFKKGSPFHLNLILVQLMSRIKVLSVILEQWVSDKEITIVENKNSNKDKSYYLIRGYWVNKQGQLIRDIRVQLNYLEDIDKVNQSKLESKLNEVFNVFDCKVWYDYRESKYLIYNKDTKTTFYFSDVEHKELFRLFLFSSHYHRYKVEFLGKSI